MVRKVVLGAVFTLGLLTLVVSAQQPANNQSSSQARQSQPNLPVDVAPVPPRPPVIPAYPNPSFGWQPSMPRALQAENADLHHQSEALVNQLAKAKGGDRERIKAKLAETLEKQFDLRQKRHQAEIAALEAQVRQLKELVQKRQDNRQEIISKRLDQLARDAEGLGW